jgi:hypothetical protein
MIYHLITTVKHPEFHEPEHTTIVLHGDTMADIWKQIEAHPRHIHNLKRTGKTAFKDVDGVCHVWVLKEIVGPN